MKKDNEDSSQVEDSLRSEQGLEFEFAATTEDDKFKFFNALKEVDDSHMKDLLANMPDSSDEFSDTMELLRGLQVEKGADSSNINAKEIVDQTDMYLTGHFIDDKGQKSIEEIIEQDYSFSFDSITDISKQNLSSKALETERQPLVSDIESSMDLSSKSIHILPTRRHGKYYLIMQVLLIMIQIPETLFRTRRSLNRQKPFLAIQKFSLHILVLILRIRKIHRFQKRQTRSRYLVKNPLFRWHRKALNPVPLFLKRN